MRLCEVIHIAQYSEVNLLDAAVWAVKRLMTVRFDYSDVTMHTLKQGMHSYA